VGIYLNLVWGSAGRDVISYTQRETGRQTDREIQLIRSVSSTSWTNSYLLKAALNAVKLLQKQF